MQTIQRTLLTLAALALMLTPVLAEHPSEHPTEHPSDHGSTVSKENLAEAIEMYVSQEAEVKGGYFLVFDGKADKPLVLSLKKVHKERLSKVGKDTYFACADFVTPGGKAYDLDIFMKGADAENLVVTEVSVHKEDGKARYKWQQKRGVWKKKKL